jgi:secreted PhoX family phosphatase
VSGSVYALRLGKRSGNADWGQGTQTGRGTWVPVPNPVGDLRAFAAAGKLTGYYRPEDSDLDPVALAKGNVRFCTVNTGNEGDDHNWGEVLCLTDGTVTEAAANTAVPEAQVLVGGTPGLAMPDNIAYQPNRGNFLLQEDGDQLQGNNDVWSCLDDGADDDDEQSDGCLRIATLNDLNAEWTGGFFDPTGRRLYISVQHNVIGRGVVLAIDGFRVSGEDD